MKADGVTSGARLLLAMALLCGGPACANPIVDDRIDALGDEPLPDLEDFQYHRAGQPCVLCHGEYEAEGPIMSLGGTIYRSRDSRVPVEGAVVKFWDAFGETHTAVTNCVGNFWVDKEVFDPAFPVHVEVEYFLAEDLAKPDPQPKVQPMASRVSRDGSCAGCHQDLEPSQFSPGRVYASPDPAAIFPPISPTCPVPPPQE